ncbi:permease prefix domain 1-containing protein [Streptomyces sp. NPDC017958]|uniref:permease prefix domain 1-containing protein n=1 Tax=Streptomyces sp. NPDC017958 TaxID=3365021 RepID=UPI00378948E9
MATPHVIDTYLDTLAGRLPADVVAELADGLGEAYDHHRRRGLDPEQAAVAALTEFGPPHEVIAAFADMAPGRRVARTLLATGPVVGGCWAATLLTTGLWPTLPGAAHAILPLVLLAVITLLVVAWRGAYRRIRTAAIAATVGIVLIDATALTTLVLLAPTVALLPTAAAAASAGRIALALRALPQLRTTST